MPQCPLILYECGVSLLHVYMERRRYALLKKSLPHRSFCDGAAVQPVPVDHISRTQPDPPASNKEVASVRTVRDSRAWFMALTDDDVRRLWVVAAWCAFTRRARGSQGHVYPGFNLVAELRHVIE